MALTILPFFMEITESFVVQFLVGAHFKLFLVHNFWLGGKWDQRVSVEIVWGVLTPYVFIAEFRVVRLNAYLLSVVIGYGVLLWFVTFVVTSLMLNVWGYNNLWVLTYLTNYPWDMVEIECSLKLGMRDPVFRKCIFSYQQHPLPYTDTFWTFNLNFGQNLDVKLRRELVSVAGWKTWWGTFGVSQQSLKTMSLNKISLSWFLHVHSCFVVRENLEVLHQYIVGDVFLSQLLDLPIHLCMVACMAYIITQRYMHLEVMVFYHGCSAIFFLTHLDQLCDLFFLVSVLTSNSTSTWECVCFIIHTTL